MNGLGDLLDLLGVRLVEPDPGEPLSCHVGSLEKVGEADRSGEATSVVVQSAVHDRSRQAAGALLLTAVLALCHARVPSSAVRQDKVTRGTGSCA